MMCSSPTASASLPISGYLFAARTFWSSGQISSSGCRYRSGSSLDWRYSSRARFAFIEAQPAEATTNAAVVHAAGRYIGFTGGRRISRSGAARESEKGERPGRPGHSRITRCVSLSRLDGRVFGRIALAIAGVDPELPGVRLDDPEHVLVALFLLVALVDDVIDAAVLEILLVEQPVGAEVVLARLAQRLEPGDALERPVAVLLRGKLVVSLLLLLVTLPDMKAPAVVAAVWAIVMDRHLALGQLEVLGRRRKRERRGHQQPGQKQKLLESFDHEVLRKWRSNLLLNDTCQRTKPGGRLPASSIANAST